MILKKLFITTMAAFVPLLLFSQTATSQLRVVGESTLKLSKHNMPKGDFSGIAYLGGNRYAVVSDKSATEGYYIFNIHIDSVTGRVLNVDSEGFVDFGMPNRDAEGIVYFAAARSVFVAGEQDSRIIEYTLNGKPTGRQIAVPQEFRGHSLNYGIESLTYNSNTGLFWTTSESTLAVDGPCASPFSSVGNTLRLQSFTSSLKQYRQYLYRTDAPVYSGTSYSNYAMGVSELCSLDDGRLIVLEREFVVKKKKVGSFVNCKLYVVNPAATAPGDTLSKTLLTEFRTKLTLFGRRLANYEGMCLGPRLADGSRTLVMINDSQGRYAGVLRDWIKVITIR